MKKSLKIMFTGLIILTFIGCGNPAGNGTGGNGNSSGNGNGGNGNQNGSVEATFTVEQFSGTQLYYRFDWQSFPGARYYNIYRLSSDGNPVIYKGTITNTTTFADNETVTYSNTAGRYYWVTAVLPGGGETQPPENKIIKLSWNFYTTSPSYILQYKTVEYVPYSSIPVK